MTVTAINPEPPKASPDEFETLYRAWRYAKAQWDLAENDPAKPEGLSEEEGEAHCDAEHRAFLTFLLHPISAPDQLARKLCVIRDQEAWRDGKATEIFVRLAEDARTLAYGPRV